MTRNDEHRAPVFYIDAAQFLEKTKNLTGPQLGRLIEDLVGMHARGTLGYGADSLAERPVSDEGGEHGLEDKTAICVAFSKGESCP